MQKGLKIQDNKVILYSTTVFSLNGNVVTLDNGGWVTASTRKAIMTAFDRHNIKGRITIRKGEMYMVSGDDLVPFVDNQLVFVKGE